MKLHKDSFGVHVFDGPMMSKIKTLLILCEATSDLAYVLHILYSVRVANPLGAPRLTPPLIPPPTATILAAAGPGSWLGHLVWQSGDSGLVFNATTGFRDAACSRDGWGLHVLLGGEALPRTAAALEVPLCPVSPGTAVIVEVRVACRRGEDARGSDEGPGFATNRVARYQCGGRHGSSASVDDVGRLCFFQLQILWLQFQIARGPVRAVGGRVGGPLEATQTGPQSTPTNLGRTTDNLKLQPHQL